MDELESIIEQWSDLVGAKANSLGMDEDLLLKVNKDDSDAVAAFNDVETRLKKLRHCLQAQREGSTALTSELGNIRTALKELQADSEQLNTYRSEAEANLKATEEALGRLKLNEEHKLGEQAALDTECKVFEELCKMRLLKINDTDLQFVFTHIDELDPDLPFVFSLRPEAEGYTVFDMDPLLPGLAEMTDELNASKDMGWFVRAVRQKWLETCSQSKELLA